MSNNIKVLGIDLTKNIFQLHGVDVKGKVVLQKRLSRSKLPEVIAKVLSHLLGGMRRYEEIRILAGLRHKTDKIVKSSPARFLIKDSSFLDHPNVLYAGNGYLSRMEILEP